MMAHVRPVQKKMATLDCFAQLVEHLPDARVTATLENTRSLASAAVCRALGLSPSIFECTLASDAHAALLIVFQVMHQRNSRIYFTVA